MTRSSIGPFQLFSLIFLFEIGSAAVVNVGMDAKQDAWIAILIGMLCGLAIFTLYHYLVTATNGAPLTTVTRLLLGKYLGWLAGSLYVLYFFYIAARVLRDFSELLVTSTLNQTPIMIIAGMMMLLVGWAAYEGIEVIARVSELVFVFVILGAIFAFIALCFSDVTKLESLQPVLEFGWLPIIKTAFPLTMTFPFGETVVFLMLLPHLQKHEKGRRVGLFAILGSGLTLCTIIMTNIAVSGVARASSEQFPLLSTVGKIHLAGLIQRMDIVAISMLIIGGFFKILIFFYAGLAGVKDLFRIQQRKWLLGINGALVLFLTIYSVKMAPDFASHLRVGLQIVPYYMHIPLQYLLPLLLGLILLARRRFGRNFPS